VSPSFSPAQQKVLALIATGSSTGAAAAAVGVHRNTVSNWLSIPAFRQAFEQAEADRADYFREQADAMAAEAYAAVRAMLTDPAVPAAVRLKAALAMIDRAAAPGPVFPPEPTVAAENPQNVHNSAQSAKPGRNEMCPCGSGIKFKRCCLGKVEGSYPTTDRAGAMDPNTPASPPSAGGTR
jgi:hypothetical protein